MEWPSPVRRRRPGGGGVLSAARLTPGRPSGPRAATPPLHPHIREAPRLLQGSTCCWEPGQHLDLPALFAGVCLSPPLLCASQGQDCLPPRPYHPRGQRCPLTACRELAVQAGSESAGVLSHAHFLCHS